MKNGFRSLIITDVPTAVAAIDSADGCCPDGSGRLPPCADSLPSGQWQVTLDVRARKVVYDSAGVRTEVKMGRKCVKG